jgi:putative membrane protein
MKLLLNWLTKTLVLLVVAYFVPGFHIDSFLTALAVVVVLTLLNLLVKPLIQLLTLPINILTLGLFSFIINALILWLAAYLVKGFSIDSFFTALVASVVIALVSLVVNKLIE